MQAAAELRQKLVGWAESNVVPTLTAWKSRLDAAMAPEDLRALNLLRVRARALQKEMITNGMAMRDAWHLENYTALKSTRDKMKQLMESGRALLEELKPIAVKYRSTLEGIGAEAKPIVEGWKKQGKEIVRQWREQHPRPDGANGGDAPPAEMGGMGPMGMRGGLLGRLPMDVRSKLAAARFMLWDGQTSPGSFSDELDDMPELD